MNLTKASYYSHYTVGFYLSNDLKNVALVLKCKPEWQKGLLNGVGGKMEDGESIEMCMFREFEEETGWISSDWIHFATGNVTNHQGLCVVHYLITCGYMFVPKEDSKEQVSFYNIKSLLEESKIIVPNIKWLIPLGLLKYQNPSWEEPATFQTI